MMRRIYVLTLLMSLLCFSACRENYYIEHELHGMWQVTFVERLSTGKVSEPQGALYYMFQRGMVALCVKHQGSSGGMTRYIAHFDLLKDSIGMGDFRYYTTGEGGFVNDEKKVPIDRLERFGIYQDYTVFHMKQSKQKLILTSDSSRVVFCRY